MKYSNNFESLPIYKPTLPPMVFGTRDKKVKGGQDALVLRYLTPHANGISTQHIKIMNACLLYLEVGLLFGFLMKTQKHMI